MTGQALNVRKNIHDRRSSKCSYDHGNYLLVVLWYLDILYTKDRNKS